MRINFASTRLAFVLIGLLVLMMVTSAVIPQRGIAEEQLLDWQEMPGDWYEIFDILGLDRIYTTPPFFVVITLLAVNLLVGNVRRFRAVYKTERTLFRLRHVGSILFHFSLLTVMVGIVGNYLFRYDGVLALTVGQSVSDGPEGYLREFKGPLHATSYGRYQMTLKDLSVNRLPDGQSADTAAVVLATPAGDATIESVATGRPLLFGDIEFHFGQRSGYSPELLITDSTGMAVFRSFVRVAIRKSGGRAIHEDFIDLPDAGVTIGLSIEEALDPALPPKCQVNVIQDSVTLLDSLLAVGQTASAGGLQISVPRLRRWCYINAVQSPYLTVVFVGFWASLGGLALTLIARVSKKGIS